MLDPRKISNPSQPCSSQMVRQLLHPVEAYLSWNVCSRTSSISHSEPVTLAPTTTTPSAWHATPTPGANPSQMVRQLLHPVEAYLSWNVCSRTSTIIHSEPVTLAPTTTTPSAWHATPTPGSNPSQVAPPAAAAAELLQTQISRTFKIFTSHKFLNSISSRVILKKNWLV